MQKCNEWFESYIKRHQPIEPSAVYAAGSKLGFSRAEIKQSRKWYGKYVDTETRGGRTLWRWNS